MTVAAPVRTPPRPATATPSAPPRLGVRPPPVSPAAPQPRHSRLPEDVQTIPDAVRSMGISAWATKGAGKSRALGRLIAWQDFYRGVPLVMFDPIGAAIDHVLDKLLQLPPAERLAAEERVRYVRVAGQDGLVVPFPILSSAAEKERFSDI